MQFLQTYFNSNNSKKQIFDISNWSGSKNLYYGVIFSCLFSLIFAKHINLNSYLGLPVYNNFLSILISLGDFSVLLVLIHRFLKIVIYKIKKENKIAIFSVLSVQLLLSILIFSNLLFSSQFSLVPAILQFARLLLWFSLAKDIWQYKHVFWLVIMASLFDHYMISSSVSVLLIYLLINFKKYTLPNWFSYLFVTFLSINFILAFYQFSFGKSLGLFYLGEPVLNMSQNSVAYQRFGESLFLRGYGLTQHPNILGFIGVSGLIFWLNKKSNEFVIKKWLSGYTIFVSTALIVLSFSRIAYLASFAISLYHKKAYKNRVLVYSLVTTTCVLLTLFSITKPDWNRISDLSMFFQGLNKLSFWEFIFGVGYYPQFLHDNFSDFQSWQWQPVHNFWLNILIQYGVIFVVVVFLEFYRNRAIRHI